MPYMVNHNIESRYYNVPLKIAEMNPKKLPQNYKLLFALILSFKKNPFKAHDDYICQILGVGKSSVQRGLKMLEELELIERRVSRYRGKVINRTISPLVGYRDVFGIPAELFTSKELNATDKLLYGIIAYWAGEGVRNNGMTTASNAQLGELIGISPQLTSKRLKFLEQQGLVKVERSDDKQYREITPLVALYTDDLAFKAFKKICELEGREIDHETEERIRAVAIEYTDKLTEYAIKTKYELYYRHHGIKDVGEFVKSVRELLDYWNELGITNYESYTEHFAKISEDEPANDPAEQPKDDPEDDQPEQQEQTETPVINEDIPSWAQGYADDLSYFTNNDHTEQPESSEDETEYAHYPELVQQAIRNAKQAGVDLDTKFSELEQYMSPELMEHAVRYAQSNKTKPERLKGAMNEVLMQYKNNTPVDKKEIEHRIRRFSTS